MLVTDLELGLDFEDDWPHETAGPRPPDQSEDSIIRADQSEASIVRTDQSEASIVRTDQLEAR